MAVFAHCIPHDRTPGVTTILYTSGEYRGRPNALLHAQGLFGTAARACVDAILPLPDGRVLVSVRAGSSKAPKSWTVVLDVNLHMVAEISGFGRPFTRVGARIGGAIDARSGRLGILDLNTLAVTATGRFAPGVEIDGELIGLDEEGVLRRGEDVLAGDLEILAVLPDGFVGRRDDRLHRGGAREWSWDAPAPPRRVALGGGRIGVMGDAFVAALDASTGREIFVRPNLASQDAGFYGAVGALEDVAVLPNGLVVVATHHTYPTLVVLDDTGDYRVSAVGPKRKRAGAVASFGLAVLVGGSEKGVREQSLLTDELVVAAEREEAS